MSIPSLTRLPRPIVALAALLLGAAAPLGNAPFNWPLASVLSIAGLFGLLSIRPHAKSTFATGWLYAMGCFSVGVSWVHVPIDTYGGLPLAVSFLLMLLLCAYLALFPAIACLLWHWLSQNRNTAFAALLFPSCWVLGEFARGKALTGFPWLALGYSGSSDWFAGWAPLVGVEGLSFIMALTAVLILLAIRQTNRPPVLLALLTVIGATWQVNQLRFVETTGETAQMALVQGNAPLMLKWSPEQFWPILDKYQNLSRPYYDHDIVIWPEAAIPSVELVAHEQILQLNNALTFNNSALISGIIDYQLEADRYFNSLIVLGVYNAAQPEQTYFYGNRNRYSKHHLLPIGEFVPFEALLRPLAPLFNLPNSSFSRGAYRQANLIANGWRFAPAICYEIVFPEQVRQSVNNTTDFILTVSNDTWFGHSIGPHQHLEIAKMRALELQRPVVRATNDGITTVIDVDGNEIDTLPQFTEGVLSVEVNRYRGMTPFSQWGHWPILLLCSALGLLAVLLKRKPQSPQAPTPTKPAYSSKGPIEPRQ